MNITTSSVSPGGEQQGKKEENCDDDKILMAAWPFARSSASGFGSEISVFREKLARLGEFG